MVSNEYIRKISALQKLCGVLSRRQIDDASLVAMVESFEGISANDVEKAVDWSIKNNTTLPTPSEMREGIENGQYKTIERVSVCLSQEERITSYWKEDMEDCGIKDENTYKEHISRWERENPGLSYYEAIVKRRY